MTREEVMAPTLATNRSMLPSSSTSFLVMFRDMCFRWFM